MLKSSMMVLILRVGFISQFEVKEVEEEGGRREEGVFLVKFLGF